jgi:hypothetical protein
MVSSWVDTIAKMKENEGHGGIYSLLTKTSHYVPTVVRVRPSQKTNHHAVMIIRSRLSPTTSHYDVVVIMTKLSQKKQTFMLQRSLGSGRPKKLAVIPPTVIRVRLSPKTSHYPPMAV